MVDAPGGNSEGSHMHGSIETAVGFDATRAGQG